MGMNTGVRGKLDGVCASSRCARQSGFTIVETMVVLAVTGALFVAIAATLSGRQNAAEFTHAIQSIRAQIQQTINQVSAGFYPSQDNFTCADNAGTVQITAGTNAQGTNQDCVFLGKVMQFGVQGTGVNNPEQYQIYSIAGLRQASAGGGSPFLTSDPTVLGFSGAYPSFSTAAYLEYGLSTQWMRYGGSSCTSKACSIGAFAVLMEPGSLAGSAGSGIYSTATQQVDLIPIGDSLLNQSVPGAVGAIENHIAGSGGLRDPALSVGTTINPPLGVQICFVSGGTNQSGLITIGGSGRQLLVTLDIKSNKNCT